MRLCQSQQEAQTEDFLQEKQTADSLSLTHTTPERLLQVISVRRLQLVKTQGFLHSLNTVELCTLVRYKHKSLESAAVDVFLLPFNNVYFKQILKV